MSPPRVATTELEILDPAQVTALLQKLEGHGIYPLTVLALATGMRRGELRSITLPATAIIVVRAHRKA